MRGQNTAERAAISILVVLSSGRRAFDVRVGGTLRVTRTPFLPEMTDEEKEAARERRANRPPRSDDDRGRRQAPRLMTPCAPALASA